MREIESINFIGNKSFEEFRKIFESGASADDIISAIEVQASCLGGIKKFCGLFVEGGLANHSLLEVPVQFLQPEVLKFMLKNCQDKELLLNGFENGHPLLKIVFMLGAKDLSDNAIDKILQMVGMLIDCGADPLLADSLGTANLSLAFNHANSIRFIPKDNFFNWLNCYEGCSSLEEAVTMVDIIRPSFDQLTVDRSASLAYRVFDFLKTKGIGITDETADSRGNIFSEELDRIAEMQSILFSASDPNEWGVENLGVRRKNISSILAQTSPSLREETGLAWMLPPDMQFGRSR